MTPANAELLYSHSKECDSHEFFLRVVDGNKQYHCLKCKNQITEEPDVAPPVTAQVPEARKAA